MPESDIWPPAASVPWENCSRSISAQPIRLGFSVLILSRSEANHSEFNNWLVMGAHRLHMSLMIDDTLKRDHLDILFEAVCRWINEGSASRIPEGRVMHFRVDEEASEKSALSSEERVGTRFASAAALNSQDATEKVRCLDELWRFSCETPDAPHLM